MQLWSLIMTLRPSTIVVSWLILDVSLDMTQNLAIMGLKCKWIRRILLRHPQVM